MNSDFMTGMTVSSVKKTNVSKEQERLVQAVSSENLAGYKAIEGDLKKIYPIGNKILIKVEVEDFIVNGKVLYTGSETSTSRYNNATYEVVGISDFVKTQDQWKALAVGDKVKVNMALLVHTQGNTPCLEWKEGVKVCSIWSVQPDRIDYAFKGGDTDGE